MARLFDTGNIIECIVDENDLSSFMFRPDIDDAGKRIYPDKEISDILMNALPEYVFANYESITTTNAMEKIREAAKALYNTEEYEAINKYYIEGDTSFKEKAEKHQSYSRGEFGEILLHILLRDFKGTIPLISKVHFKDSRGVPAHGFDAVHISPNEKILWLGESKLYTDGKEGVNALIGDLKEHFTKDYMNEQFTIIKKCVDNNTIPERDYWIKRLTQNKLLTDMISHLCIPLLCVYSDKSYIKWLNQQIADIASILKSNTRNLKQYFDQKNDAPLKDQLDIVLFLMPVKDKHEFVVNAHKKLNLLQQL